MKDKNKKILFIVVFIFAIFSTILISITAAKFNSDKSLALLAAQFTKGHISLEPTEELPAGDISIYNGKYYMYFGPLASIMLMPFVAIFGSNFPQIIIGFTALILTFFAVYSLSKSFKFSSIDALWLSLFFVFSTVVFSTSVINITSYLVEALGVPLVLISLAEYFGKKRPLVIGLFLGLAVLTRAVLILATIFFIVEFLKKRVSKKQFGLILIPFALCLIFYGSYNFLRFQSFIETGYRYHMEHPFPLSENFSYGEVSLIHLPANLYSFFIMPPEPILEETKGFVLKFPYLKANPWGMAIWFTSPLFLLFFRFRKNIYSISAGITAFCLAVPLFIYFSVGFAQFGYRYALDFLPFLFLLLIPSLSPKLSRIAITLIIIGVVFNCIFITSLWDVYPHFGIYK